MRVGTWQMSYRGVAAGLAAGLLALSACSADAANSAADGVPLAELDLGGPPPVSVALAGSDDVVVTSGPAFSVRAEGSPAATARLRFTRQGAGLAIRREHGAGNGGGSATVHIILPAVHGLTLSGSGNLASDTLSGAAEVAISGSGDVSVRQVRADSLKVALAGSGEFEGSGTARALDLNLQGSGTADLGGLRVEHATVALAGSGKATFASDGRVDASIAGSGSVRVRGNAQCMQSRAGSGRLTCTP